MTYNNSFACVSQETMHWSVCPSGWTSAVVGSTGGRVEVGKCYKRLNQSYTPNCLTWNDARALCIREGGDLLSVGTDLEGLWLQNYTSELLSLLGLNRASELWLYVNLYRYLYCPLTGQTSWCWNSRLVQGALAFPSGQRTSRQTKFSAVHAVE